MVTVSLDRSITNDQKMAIMQGLVDAIFEGRLQEHVHVQDTTGPITLVVSDSDEALAIVKRIITEATS